MEPSDPYSLILVPTDLERSRLHLEDLETRSSASEGNERVAIVGFGPIAAAARTAQLVTQSRPRHVFLVGIAGTYDPDRFPIGSAHRPNRVISHGVGLPDPPQSSRTDGTQRPRFPQWTGSPGLDENGSPLPNFEVANTIDLDSGALASGPTLLTVTRPAEDQEEADQRRSMHSAELEDMEGFGVALACRLLDTPLTIIRGISNSVGDRCLDRWVVDEALQSARSLLIESLVGSPSNPNERDV